MTFKPALPNVSSAINAWSQALTVVQIGKEMHDFEAVESQTTKRTRGLLLPFKAQELVLKPEGQRSWRWFKLHCTPSLMLRIDDAVSIEGTRYRVMAVSDFANFGAMEYDLVQDYQK